MMESNKLLPCPFCGGEVGWKNGSITCDRCDLKFRYFSTGLTEKRWNTRKPMERIVEQLEEERKYSFEYFREDEVQFRKGLREAIRIIKKAGGKYETN